MVCMNTRYMYINRQSDQCLFQVSDLVPVFLSSRKVIIPQKTWSSFRGGRDAEEDVFGGADHVGPAGCGGGDPSHGGLPEDGCIRAIVLPLEEEVHGDGDRRVSPSAAVGGREPQAEGDRGGPEAGQ